MNGGGGATSPGTWTEEQSPAFGVGEQGAPKGLAPRGTGVGPGGHYLWRRSPGAGVAGGEPSICQDTKPVFPPLLL